MQTNALNITYITKIILLKIRLNYERVRQNRSKDLDI